MSKFAATLAALMLVVPASALAQDLRSPDARPAAQQDYRSPDAKPIAFRQDYRSPDAKLAVPRQDYRLPDAKLAVPKQDYRSPDARPTPSPQAAVSAQDMRSPDATPRGQFDATAPPTASSTPASFSWGFLAAGIALVLIGLGAMTLTQRRRRHGLAVGS